MPVSCYVFCLQEEKTARELLEAEKENLSESHHAALAELQRRLEGRLSAEAAEHAATKAQLADAEKQRAALSVQLDAQKAQLQADSISTRKQLQQYEQQKSALEVFSPTPLEPHPFSAPLPKKTM